MQRILFVLAILLVAGATFADPQRYPFKLSIRADSGKQVVMLCPKRPLQLCRNGRYC
jgi:hypothetical protein